MPAIAGMFLASEVGLVDPGCCPLTDLSAPGLPFFHISSADYLRRRLEAFLLAFRLAGRFFALRLAFFLALRLVLRFAFFLALRLVLRLAFFLALRLVLRFAFFLALRLVLRLAFFLALRLVLRFAFFLALRLVLRLAFFFTLRLAFFLALRLVFLFVLRLLAFLFVARRLATFRFAFLRVTLRFFATFRLEAFLRDFFLVAILYLRVGYPALSIYNKTEKSSKSSDAVNIFEIVFFGQNSR